MHFSVKMYEVYKKMNFKFSSLISSLCRTNFSSLFCIAVSRQRVEKYATSDFLRALVKAHTLYSYYSITRHVIMTVTITENRWRNVT